MTGGGSTRSEATAPRSMGLMGATGVGVGAIVGGGILALAGVAFAATGPGALAAFTLNGLIALVTALTFAEMATAFPESGGVYAFSKKVLSVEAAFAFGWVVWFASIMAAVLYALGFAAYAVIAVEPLWTMISGTAPAFLARRSTLTALAIAATACYLLALVRRATGGGEWATWGKVFIFGALIAGGCWALLDRTAAETSAQLQPFFPRGGIGLVEAMGYTFIALQGFDLIAAVAGEVRKPGKNIPRAMLMSLGIALAIYLPFLFITATVGVPTGESIVTASTERPEAVVAVAAHNYMGPLGYWLVVLAALLAMLSALRANILAASRVALAMARDRTLPVQLAELREPQGSPAAALLVTTGIVIAILLVVPDVAAAGAASSLIFLLTFALTHGLNLLTGKRGGTRDAPFKVPFSPFTQIGGGLACFALAVFQGIQVPAAGLVTATWLGIGGFLFLSLFARRARVVDASAEALDPRLIRLRGRSPLVLVPIANPASAEALVGVANALAPPRVGRVLLHSVIQPPGEWIPGAVPAQLSDTQAVLREALSASFAAGLAPEALATVAPIPWQEIVRVAQTHRCEALLLGMGKLTDEFMGADLEQLMSLVDCDVVLLRAQPGWRLSEVRRVLVAVGGRGDHDALRARLLGSLLRTGEREIRYLRVLPANTARGVAERARHELVQLARDEAPGAAAADLVYSDDVAAEVARRAAECDLVVLGLQRISRRQKIFGEVSLRVARDTNTAVLMISRRG